MLKINIDEKTLFNEENNEFIYVPAQELLLEHSLISISKWESKWKKPFISKTQMTKEETLDYIRCMIVNTPKENYIYGIGNKEIELINRYIEDPMTATWFKNNSEKKPHEIITSEIIYYSMIAYNIPLKCEQWHLNRLLTLIRVCSEKNNPKKMSKKDIYSRNRALNDARRKAAHSKG